MPSADGMTLWPFLLLAIQLLMELLIANVGLDLGLFPPSVFDTLVLTALISTALATPALRSLLPQIRLAAE